MIGQYSISIAFKVIDESGQNNMLADAYRHPTRMASTEANSHAYAASPTHHDRVIREGKPKSVRTRQHAT